MRPILFAAAFIALSGCAFWKNPVETVEAEPVGVGRPIAQAGEMCSGIAGIQCAEGLACIFEEGVCSSMADASGTCMKTPTICTREYMPVCGCNGETYGNKCEALAAGVSVAAQGECEPEGS